MTEKKRTNFVRVPNLFILEKECYLLRQAMGAMCYLVGSALTTDNYNDVDIRMIMSDEAYEKLFGDSTCEQSLFWNVLCTLISRDLSEKSHEKVDFQIQSMEHANKRHAYSRQPMGMYPHDMLPSWHGHRKEEGDE